MKKVFLSISIVFFLFSQNVLFAQEHCSRDNLMLAKEYELKKDYEMAIIYYLRQLEINEKWCDETWYEDNHVMTESLEGLANIYIIKRENENAEKYLLRALYVSGGCSGVPAKRDTFLLKLAEFYKERGRYKEAEELEKQLRYLK